MKNLVAMVTLLLAACIAAGAQRQMVATTTLRAETSNNTSAADSFAGTPNGNLPAGNVSKVPVSALMYPGATTKYLVAMMGWFGSPKHKAVGYNSADAAQVRRQLLDMKSRGFDGTTIAWYGSEPNEQSNQTTLRLKAEAEKVPGFAFALRVNEGLVKWYAHGLSPTDALIQHLKYAADTYFPSPAYLRIHGRPVLLEFGLDTMDIDWNRVKNSVPGNPLWIFRNPGGFTKPNSAGAYAWGPSDTFDYLDRFYTKAQGQRGKITIGNVYKGFDDRVASWSKDRTNDQRCGQTWLGTFAKISEYYSAKNQLPLVMVTTWNDYEEGTEIETGIDNCLSLTATVSGDTLRWALNGDGQESTIHHYTVFASLDGDNLMPVVELRTSVHSVNLAQFDLRGSTYTLYVKATGQPSIRNVMSNGTRYVVRGAR